MIMEIPLRWKALRGKKGGRSGCLKKGLIRANSSMLEEKHVLHL